ncbi:hypothetical protein ACEF17_07425 [Streptococcus hyovaginalis]
MSASMSFANGKDDQGNWKRDYINVVAYRDVIPKLENAVGQLVEIEGYYRVNEHNGNKYPQIVVNKVIGGGQQSNAFANSNPIDISDDMLPF